jgi:hypothetical protein
MGFRMIISKSRLLGLLVLLVVGYLVLRPGDEPSDSDNRGGDSESATERRLQSREPAFLRRDDDQGIAGWPGQGEAWSPGDRREYYREGSDPDLFPQEYQITDPYRKHGQVNTDGYRFRPLDEKEQRRAQAHYPDQYQYPGQQATPYNPSIPYYPFSGSRQGPATPAPYSAPPAYREPPREIYSFRTLEKSPAARGRWQGPYQEPGRRFDGYPMDPWTSPPPPQWGSTPPAQRMYPNLYRSPDRRLTAR